MTTGAISGAGAAHADDGPAEQSGASATLSGLETYDSAVIHQAGKAGKSEEVSAGLFRMTVEDGGTLQTYSVDLRSPTQPDARYRETSWSGTSLGANPNAGRIRWILQNSYPQVNDLAALARTAHAGSLTEQEAAAGTQVAIWRYSNASGTSDTGSKADKVDVEAVSPAAEKLADHLQRGARRLAEPRDSLELTPRAVSGRPGERVGPVTVHTNADSVSVQPPADAAARGVELVDGKGEPVTTAKNGSRLYFDVPKTARAGSAELTVQASTTVPVGRAFASDTRSQPQIIAGSSESTVSATAAASWADKGAAPALSARENCAKGGVDITATNAGDAPYAFTLMGTRHTIPAGTTRTVAIPLQEDQAYDFTIKGPGAFEKRIRGVLDCATAAGASAGGGLTTQAPCRVPGCGDIPR